MPFLEGEVASVVREAVQGIDAWTGTRWGRPVILVQESQEEASGNCNVTEKQGGQVTSGSGASASGPERTPSTPPTQLWRAETPPSHAVAWRRKPDGEDSVDDLSLGGGGGEKS